MDVGADVPVDASAACPAYAVRPDGGCCGGGLGWAGDQCAMAGPPECAGTVFSNPTACVPRWCWSGLTWDDKPCATGTAGCFLGGRTCSDGDLQGPGSCPVGTRPTAAGECALLGRDATVTAADVLQPLPPPTTPQPPRVCTEESTGFVRECKPGEAGCPVGEERDPQAQGQCRPLLGTDLLCPPGFVQVPAADPDDLPACAPDPGDCGTDPFGGVQDGPKTRFVDASFVGKSSGQRAAPFTSVGAALVDLPEGGTIAVAAGQYPEPLNILHPVDVVGRCAALTTLAPPFQVGITVLAAAAGGARIRRITIDATTTGMTVNNANPVAIERAVIRAQDVALLVGSASTVNVRDSLFVANSPTFADAVGGQGIHCAGKSAKATLERVRISNFRAMGLHVSAAGAVTATDVLVTDINPTGNANVDGNGIVVGSAGQLDLRRARLFKTRAEGMYAWESGSTLVARQVLVDTTAVRPFNGQDGQGLLSLNGTLRLENARIVYSHASGIDVRGSGAVATLRGVRVAHTRPPDAAGPGGEGLLVHQAAHVTAQDMWFEDNRDAGIAVEGDGSVLLAERTLVAATRPAGPGFITGVGVDLSGGAMLRARWLWLSDNATAGVYAAGQGTAGYVEDFLCLGTVGGAKIQDFGPGLLVDDGAQVRATRGRIVGSEGVGVSVAGLNSRLDLSDFVISGTLPQSETKDFGIGLVQQTGSIVHLAAVRLVGNRGVGILVHGEASRLTGHGVVVDGTEVRESDGGGGHGIYAAGAGEAELEGLLVAANRSTGLAADHARLVVDRGVVRDTHFAPLVSPDLVLGEQLADGVVASVANWLQLTRCLIAGNQRAAVLVDATPAALVSQCVLSGGTYGLVKQHGAALTEQGTTVYGASQQDHAGDSGLAVPNPPKLAAP